MALSLVGIADMAGVVLFQTGILGRLPDPPSRRFDSAATNTSDAAYRLGAPDGAILIFLWAANALIAAFGGANRAREARWIPIAAAAKAGVEAGFAAKYFSLMATRREPWCLFCIAAALIQFAVLGLAIPEGWKAARHESYTGRRYTQ